MSLSAGAVFSGFQTDADTHPFMYGFGVYADYNPLPFLGVEIEGRTIQFNSQNNIRQDTISGGFRYIHNVGRFAPYAKVLGGLGSADFPKGTYDGSPGRQHDTFSAMTLGGGLDYRLTHRVYLRGDYEYQFWFDYGRGLGKPGMGTINPNGFSIGASYKFF
jgi:opacity protein-like surface antigen